jgi:F-type H+-transporting ATPase subunit delta
MSDIETAARPYARAIYELASEGGKLQSWDDSLQVAALIARDAQIQALFQSPSLLSSEQVDIFLSVYSGVKRRI